METEEASDDEELSSNEEITLSPEEYLENILVYGDLDSFCGSINTIQGLSLVLDKKPISKSKK